MTRRISDTKTLTQWALSIAGCVLLCLISIHPVSAQGSTLTQSDYRWFENRNHREPNVPLSAENSTPTGVSLGEVVRLRTNMLVSDQALTEGSTTLKLQYAASVSGPWTDVGNIGSTNATWRGYDNFSVSDGATLTPSEIQLSNSDVAESYEEENPSAPDPRPILADERGEWDWVLQNYAAPPDTVYYFRMVKSDGTPLDSYVRYPTIGTIEMNSPPMVDSVSLIEMEITPQLEYTVSVTASDVNTINDVSSVELKLWYDGDGGTPSEFEFDAVTADAQNCATIVWAADDPGGTAYTGPTVLSPEPTTWSLGESTLPQAEGDGSPGDFGLTSFTFQFTFTVGKVATETTRSAKWQVAARVTDADGVTDFNYDSKAARMAFYGEISGLEGIAVDWGILNPGIDFLDTHSEQALEATVTYTANGPYHKMVKSSDTWDGDSHIAKLDNQGNCKIPQTFALKASDTPDLANAVLVNTRGTTIDDTGTATTEAGDSVNTHTLWIKLADTFEKDTYAGVITYLISNGH